MEHTRGKGLLQAVNLLGIIDAQGVEVPTAANLELGGALVLLDGDALGVRATGSQEEFLQLEELLRHDKCLKRKENHKEKKNKRESKWTVQKRHQNKAHCSNDNQRQRLFRKKGCSRREQARDVKKNMMKTYTGLSGAGFFSRLQQVPGRKKKNNEKIERVYFQAKNKIVVVQTRVELF